MSFNFCKVCSCSSNSRSSVCLSFSSFVNVRLKSCNLLTIVALDGLSEEMPGDDTAARAHGDTNTNSNNEADSASPRHLFGPTV